MRSASKSRRLPRTALTLLAGALLALVTLSPAGAAPRYDENSVATFRVATWNLLLDHLSHRGSPAARTNAVARTIVEQEIGVIGAQEVTAGQRSRLLRALPTYAATESTARTIFWNTLRYQKVDEGKFIVTKTVGSSVARWVMLRSLVNGRQFVVMSVHAEPYQKHLQHQDVAQILAEASRFTVPVVITGDMNSDSRRQETMYRGLAGSERFELAYDLTENRFGADCRTYTGQGHQQCGRANPRQIDHVYVSKAFSVNAWTNVTTPDTALASDHNPVWAEVALPPVGGVAPTPGPYIDPKLLEEIRELSKRL